MPIQGLKLTLNTPFYMMNPSLRFTLRRQAHSDTGGSPLYDLGERFIEYCSEAKPEQILSEFVLWLQSSHGRINFSNTTLSYLIVLSRPLRYCLILDLYDRLHEQFWIANEKATSALYCRCVTVEMRVLDLTCFDNPIATDFSSVSSSSVITTFFLLPQVQERHQNCTPWTWHL